MLAQRTVALNKELYRNIEINPHEPFFTKTASISASGHAGRCEIKSHDNSQRITTYNRKINLKPGSNLAAISPPITPPEPASNWSINNKQMSVKYLNIRIKILDINKD